MAAIQASYTVLYISAFDLAQEMNEAESTGTRKELVNQLMRTDLLVLEDLGMRHLPPTAAEDLLEVFVRRYEKGAIIVTSNRPLEDWGEGAGGHRCRRRYPGPFLASCRNHQTGGPKLPDA